MASFMEAMKAAREGKMVRRGKAFSWISFKDGILSNCEFTGGDDRIHILQSMLDADWEIEQPPPREYTFMEAVEMMENGKLMRSVATGTICCMTDPIFSKPDGSNFVLAPCEVKGKWIEVM